MKAVDLLDQIIEHEEFENRRKKVEKIEQGKGEEAMGESWTLFYLKRLKELLNEEEKNKE
ncbi:MAG: hypothetical protein H8E05_00910 [Bacteroidetes bacterium]|nr:hypothetical protein [Bacteroidota bacterium]